jgi:hypothetical protein
MRGYVRERQRRMQVPRARNPPDFCLNFLQVWEIVFKLFLPGARFRAVDYGGKSLVIGGSSDRRSYVGN